jgi:hypothetical protein
LRHAAWIYWIKIDLPDKVALFINRKDPRKGRLIMNSILILIIGLPLAAAIAVATSLPILFGMGSLLLFTLWYSAGREQRA